MARSLSTFISKEAKLKRLSVKEALNFFPLSQISRRHSVLVQHVRIRPGPHEITHQLGRPELRSVVKGRLTKFVYHLDYPSFRNISFITTCNLVGLWTGFRPPLRTFASGQDVLGALHVTLLDGHVHGALLVPGGGELEVVKADVGQVLPRLAVGCQVHLL